MTIEADEAWKRFKEGHVDPLVQKAKSMSPGQMNAERQEWDKLVNAAAEANRHNRLLNRLGRKALKNLTTGSFESVMMRNLGVGVGAAYTFDGVAKLVSPKRQMVVSEEGTLTTETSSRSKALLEVAAGVGIATASAFLKIGKAHSI